MDDHARRRYERIESKLPCRMFVPDPRGGDDLRFEAFVSTRNVGLGGIFVESSFLLRPGLELRVELELPSAVLEVGGRVVHSVGPEDAEYPSGMGVEFVGMDSEGRETFMRDFAPPRYRKFYESALSELPHLAETFALEDACLLLHLWEEWKTLEEGGPRATESGAPAPSPLRKEERARKQGSRGR